MQVPTSVAIMQVLRFHCIYVGGTFCYSFATVMLVDLSVVVMQVTVSVAIMQLEVSAANIWVTIVIEVMQVGVSVTIMQMVFSALHKFLS